MAQKLLPGYMCHSLTTALSIMSEKIEFGAQTK